MARMLGTFSRPRCPQCRTGWGPDCADKSRGRKAQRALEKRAWRRDFEADAFDGAKLWAHTPPADEPDA